MYKTQSVLLQLLKNSAEKCQFLAASVFFRYVITQGSIQMIQQRSLLLPPGHFPNPISGCNIFLGFVHFYHWYVHYSAVAAPHSPHLQ